MIRQWLLKHRWVNELGKTVAAGIFAYFGYLVWQGAELASYDLATGPEAFRPLMTFGVVVGIAGALSLFILTDVVVSIVDIIRKEDKK